jgi:pyrroloquinoline quinone (PQQ) biosynthesis protein C
VPPSRSITERIVAIRDRWHTKKHPFFAEFAAGRLPLKALGRYQALHYQYVQKAVASFGLLYTRFSHLDDVRKAVAENMAEEEGLKAIPQPGHDAHDHNELIFRFCRAAGLSEEEVRATKMPPAWWARSLFYYHTAATEPVGVVLAMQTTQEGQMPGLIGEVLLPAFARHYGFEATAPEIEFFSEHDAADVEHSRRQMGLCAKYLDTPELEARALTVAEEIVKLRWALISELYRADVLGEKELLPPGVGSGDSTRPLEQSQLCRYRKLNKIKS